MTTTTDGKRLLDGSTVPRLRAWRRRGLWPLLLGSLAAIGSGCGSGGSGAEPADPRGEVGISLRISEGVSIDAVAYSITGGPTPLAGTIAVGKSATISATLGPLAAGSNYALSMTATTSAGTRCTGSAGPFAVAADRSTPVSIVLTCPSLHTTGTVAVGGKISVCPRIAAVTAAPSEVYVGNDIQVAAVAGPDDAANGYPLTYAWSGASSSDGAGNAVFHCAAAGVFVLELAVDNGNPECSVTPPEPGTTSSISVTCTDDGSGSSSP